MNTATGGSTDKVQEPLQSTPETPCYAYGKRRSLKCFLLANILQNLKLYL